MSDEPYMPTTQPTQSRQSSGFSTDYLRTVPGILKCIQLALSMIVFICAQAGHPYRGAGWVSFVGISAFLGSLTLLLFHLFGILNKRGRFTLRLIIPEFIILGIKTALLLTGALVATIHAAGNAGAAAAAVFALLATAVYAADTFYQYRAWKGEREQEDQLVAQHEPVSQQVPPGLPPKYEA